MKIFSKKYIFNSRFIVRNTIAVVLSATIVAGGAAGLSAALSGSEAEEDNVAYAAESAEEKVYTVNIPEIKCLNADTLDVLSVSLEEEASCKLEVNRKVALSKSAYDMDGKFLVIADMLNMRSTPDEEGEVLGTMREGDFGEVLGTEGEWTKVSSGGLIGYVKSEYIVKDAEAAAKAEKYLVSVAKVNKEDVLIRRYGGLDSEILYTTRGGEEFKVNEDLNAEGWVAVRLYDGTNGYISSDYVTVSKGFSTALPTDVTLLADADTEEGEKDTEESGDTEEEKKNNDQQKEDNSDRKKEAEEVPSEEQVTEAPTEVVTEAPTEAPTEATTEPETEAVTEETTEAPVQAETSDLYLLAAIVYAESGAEPYEGQLAVANVVMNRLRSGMYGSTLSDVIYYPYQFSAIYTSTFENALSTGGSSLSLAAAAEAMNGNNNIGGYIAFRPLYNIDTSTLDDYTIIGNHCFFMSIY